MEVIAPITILYSNILNLHLMKLFILLRSLYSHKLYENLKFIPSNSGTSLNYQHLVYPYKSTNNFHRG